MKARWMCVQVLAAILSGPVVALVAQDTSASQAAPVTSAEGLLVALADIELRISVDRDFSGGERALDDLVAAVRAAGHADWMADSRVVAALDRARGAIARAREVDRSGLEEAVLKALATNDIEALTRLGGATFDVLRDLVLAGKVRRVNIGNSDAPNLRDVSPSAALEVAYDCSRSRTVDILVEAREPLLASLKEPTLAWTLSRMLAQHHWQFIPGKAPVPPDARLLDLVQDELASADAQALRRAPWPDLLLLLARHEAFTPAMCDRLVRLVRESTWRDVSGNVASVAGNYNDTWRRCAEPLLRALLDDERAEVRRYASARFASGIPGDALLGRAGDPDPEVRRNVARSIRSRGVSLFSVSDRGGPPSPYQYHYPLKPDERHAEVLETLVHDPDAGVREEAAQSLATLGYVPRPELLLSLTDDPDAGVRAALATMDYPSDVMSQASGGGPGGAGALEPAPAGSTRDVMAEVLLALSDDPEPLVLKAVDERLAGEDWDEDPARLMPALRARSAHPTWPFGRLIGYDPANLLEVIALHDAGRVELTRWTLQTGNPVPLRHVIRAILPSNDGGWSSRDLSPWAGMTAPEIAQLLPLLQVESPRLVTSLLAKLGQSGRNDALALLQDALVGDPAQPMELRLLVPRFGRVDLTAERLARLRGLVTEPEAWQHVEVQDPRGSTWMQLSEAIPDPKRNPWLLDLVRSETLPNGVILPLLAQYLPTDPGGEELTRWILRTALNDRTSEHHALILAVQALGALRDEESLQWLLQAARQPYTAEAAVEALSQRPEPEALLELAASVEGASLVSDRDRRTEVSHRAIRALTSKLTEEAGELLLAAASRVPTEGCRDEALKGVETIRAYLDSVDNWQRRRASSATREAAVLRLLDLLRDHDPVLRAEALRSLATLRAVEHLPAVIEALRDADESVREAAREALERLNAPDLQPAAGP